jgi:hypothetical protein
MPFENLPGIFNTKLDGNLTIPNTNDAPIVVVIGTASQGDADELFTVSRVSDATALFGKDGTLARGMYEANSAGASNLRLFRMGARAAKLADLADGAATIQTVAKDGDTGGLYKVHYIVADARLRVYRVSDDLLVFDTGAVGDPDTKVDLGEVTVTLTAALGSGVDVGLSSGDPEDSAVVLEEVPDAASPNGDPTTTFTAGDDGLTMNRMQHYEALQDAYRLLEDADLNIVVPQNVYLDDKNIMDTADATVSGLMLTVSGHSDIVLDSLNDMLGLFREEEYEGRYYYWWDVNDDGVAEIVPTVEGISSGAQTLINAGDISIAAAVGGDAADLTSGSFHEVNFAYQLANFCFRQSHLNTEMHGVIGVRPPASYSPRDVAIWVGQPPTTVVNSSGNEVITENGKGLLGNKFMFGRITAGTVGAFRNGAVNGGFIATDSGYLDGAELSDANDSLVDIGKYLDVVSAYPLLSNPARTRQYSSTGAASYAGLQTRIKAGSAATNKVVPNVQLPFRLAQSKVDLLAKRYVHFHEKPKGIVVSDAPTAARPTSDYTRRSTMNIVKACIDTVRAVGEPFLGEGMSSSQLAALETAITGALGDLAKEGIINRFDLRVSSTPSQRILGKASVDLVIVPAFELRQIFTTVALAAT